MAKNEVYSSQFEEESGFEGEYVSRMEGRRLYGAYLPRYESRNGGRENSSNGWTSSFERQNDINRNILSLRKLQLEYTEIEFYTCKAMHTIRVKSAKISNHLLEKRREIVNGPTQDKAEMRYRWDAGIPEFWLTVFANSSKLSLMLKEDDKEVLKYLADVSVTYKKDSFNFTLNFHFKPNDYFDNRVLTKEYLIDCEVDSESPYDFEGPKVLGCRGCHIEWKDGKDITHSCVENNFNGKSSFELIHEESFFNFFDPIFVDSEGDEAQEQLLDDYDVGLYIRDRIIPKAVLYYTNECHSNSEYSETDYSTDTADTSDEDPDGCDLGSDDFANTRQKLDARVVANSH